MYTAFESMSGYFFLKKIEYIFVLNKNEYIWILNKNEYICILIFIKKVYSYFY
jgi:hypothetical protein